MVKVLRILKVSPSFLRYFWSDSLLSTQSNSQNCFYKLEKKFFKDFFETENNWVTICLFVFIYVSMGQWIVVILFHALVTCFSKKICKNLKENSKFKKSYSIDRLWCMDKFEIFLIPFLTFHVFLRPHAISCFKSRTHVPINETSTQFKENWQKIAKNHFKNIWKEMQRTDSWKRDWIALSKFLELQIHPWVIES